MEKIMLASDYQEGAHPAIMKRLVETNLLSNAGYGADEFSESARKRIRTACACPNASVYFLVGGTQTNATVIDALLAPYQGILAAESGHISVHEAGAIEFGGHKVLTLPHHYGKITAGQIEETCETGSPTGTGTIWSCRAWSISPSRRSTGPSTPGLNSPQSAKSVAHLT